MNKATRNTSPKKRKLGLTNKMKSNSKRLQAENTIDYIKVPSNLSIFKEGKGEFYIDILPYRITDKTHMDRDDNNGVAVPGEFWYKRPIKVHRNVGAEGRAIICPTTFGLPCPICEMASKMRIQGADNDEIKPYKPQYRTLYYVVPRRYKDYPETVHIWNISDFCFQNLLNTELENNSDSEDFLELDLDGKMLKLRVEEHPIEQSTYNKVGRIDFIPRKKPISWSVLDKLPSLDDMLIVLDYDTIARMTGSSDEHSGSDEVPERIEVTESEDPYNSEDSMDKALSDSNDTYNDKINKAFDLEQTNDEDEDVPF